MGEEGVVPDSEPATGVAERGAEPCRDIAGLSDAVREFVRDIVALPSCSRSFSTRSATSRSRDVTSTGLDDRRLIQ